MVAIFGGKWWLLVARKKLAVSAEVVLVLFWSDFWSIKYMDKIHRRMYGRWKMMNFLLFNK